MSVVDTVLEKLHELNLNVGDRLPSERSLAGLCDISRSSVRNALKELQSKRVISVRRGSGYFIASDFALRQALHGLDIDWTLQRVEQILEACILVAGEVTVKGSEQLSQRALGDLEQTLVELGKAVINIDVATMEALHQRFMGVIHESCPNAEFIRMLNEIRIPSTYLVRLLHLAEGDERNAFFSEHVNLFQAIKKQEHLLAKQICIRIYELLSGLFGKYAAAVFN